MSSLGAWGSKAIGLWVEKGGKKEGEKIRGPHPYPGRVVTSLQKERLFS